MTTEDKKKLISALEDALTILRNDVPEIGEDAIRVKTDKAVKEIRKHGITCRVCDYKTGHIQTQENGKFLANYYATTGTIVNSENKRIKAKGIKSFISFCKGG